MAHDVLIPTGIVTRLPAAMVVAALLCGGASACASPSPRGLSIPQETSGKALSGTTDRSVSYEVGLVPVALPDGAMDRSELNVDTLHARTVTAVHQDRRFDHAKRFSDSAVEFLGTPRESGLQLAFAGPEATVGAFGLKGAAAVLGWIPVVAIAAVAVTLVAVVAFAVLSPGPHETCVEINREDASTFVACLGTTTIADLQRHELIVGHEPGSTDLAQTLYLSAKGEWTPLKDCDESDAMCLVLNPIVSLELDWKNLARPWRERWLASAADDVDQSHEELLRASLRDDGSDNQPGCRDVASVQGAFARTPAVPCGPLMNFCATVLVCASATAPKVSDKLVVSAHTVIVPTVVELEKIAGPGTLFSIAGVNPALHLRLIQASDSVGFTIAQNQPVLGWHWYPNLAPSLLTASWIDAFQMTRSRVGHHPTPLFVTPTELGAVGSLLDPLGQEVLGELATAEDIGRVDLLHPTGSAARSIFAAMFTTYTGNR